MISRFGGFVFFINLFINLIQSGRHDWMVHLDERQNVECFLYIDRYFCHISVENDHLETEVKSSLCQIGGTPLSFIALKQKSFRSEILIDWLIPFHLIERYADYLNSSNATSTHDTLICNCTAKRIGIACQYQIENKNWDLTRLLETQRGSSTNEYETLTSLIDGISCNGSVPPIEWRQICDGISQCEDASDELNCHLLELNQCNEKEEEYRCRNGMCIPKEFAFDGTSDCMDSSDEQEISKLINAFSPCPGQSLYRCDERLCRKNQFSCGDGQCVPWSSLINRKDGCRNSRHRAYRCQIDGDLLSVQKNLTGICGETTESLKPLTETSDCQLSLYHFLMADQEEVLHISMENIRKNCPERIEYFPKAILSPVLIMFYNKSQLEMVYRHGIPAIRKMSRRPHLYCLQGEMVCDDQLMKIHEQFCMTNDEFEGMTWKFPFLPFSHLFCQIVSNQIISSKSFEDHRLYRCHNTTESISFYRLNDGYRDCLYGDDERNVNNFFIQPFRYRYQTVSSPFQYVSYQQLGNGIEECLDGTDEISSSMSWLLLPCDAPESYACWIFRNNQYDLSSVVLPYFRYCNTVWDIVNGEDEKNCSQWICAKGDDQCRGTGQCLSKYDRCDGEFDCSNGEDELNCFYNNTRQWTKERDCHSTDEMFCFTDSYLKDPLSNRPCIPATYIGNDQIDCLGGRDERNTFACSDRQMLGDRFLCDQQTRCLNHSLICNGIIDCLDQTDEKLCLVSRAKCSEEQFACAKGNPRCVSGRCNRANECSDKSNWFWCPNPNFPLGLNYRSTKTRFHVPKHSRSCFPNSSPPFIPTVLRQSPVSTPSLLRGYCNRGLYLIDSNHSTPRCFCPPSYYGDRCQFDRRRITVLVIFDRWHREDIPMTFTVLIILIYNNTRIVDHQFFSDIAREFPEKHHHYLFYPRPRLPGVYSVRFEAYYSLQLLAIWEYSLGSLDFLPVFRLAKRLEFPKNIPPDQCRENLCQNNGTCYTLKTNQFVCLCRNKWYGEFCERESRLSKCSSHSLVRDEQICICPQGYLLPNCFVPNRLCEQFKLCRGNGLCYSITSQPPNQYRCFDSRVERFHSPSLLTIHRNQSSSLLSLLQLLKMFVHYPRVRQQILISPSMKFPHQIPLKFSNSLDESKSFSDIGLIFLYEPLKRTVNVTLHLLDIRCLNSTKNVTVDLNLPSYPCRFLEDNQFSSIKEVPIFCRRSSITNFCFLWKNSLCFCNSSIFGPSSCLFYDQRPTSCSHCYNGGLCVRGDLKDTEDFQCICPQCASGDLCQYSPRAFSLSLEYLIEKTGWGPWHFLFPSLFLLLGLLLNGLCFFTFLLNESRQTGAGLYLLINSITNQLIFFDLFLHILYLHLLTRFVLHPTANAILCKSLPSLLSIFYHASFWLMSFVTVERAVAATFPRLFRRWGRPRFAAYLTLVTFVFVLISMLPQFFQYELVRHSNQRFSSCIRHTESNGQTYLRYLPLVHQISPFLINFLAALLIIFSISRSKANLHHLSTRQSFEQQVKERKNLLLGPSICFITELAPLILLFLDICDYQSNNWFPHLILILYYVSFTPQLIFFFLYLYPYTLYKQLFLKETFLGKRLHKSSPLNRFFQ